MVENKAKQDALFVNLVLVFKSAAMQQMGKIINPLTGEVEKNLDQARFSIDTLEMLKDKTRSNLSHELERLLDSTLLELRMNYVEEVEAEGKAEPREEPSGERAAEDEVAAPEAGPETAGQPAPEPEGEEPLPGDSKTGEEGEGQGSAKRGRRRSKDTATGKASARGRKRRRQGGKEA